MATLEQVPQYSLKHLDDGHKERLQLAVNLPGVRSASELLVHITTQKISLRVEGRYHLALALDVQVNEKPEKLRFVKKTGVLKAEFEVLGPANHCKARAEAKPIHNSFLEDALKLRDAKTGEGSKSKYTVGSSTHPPAEDDGGRGGKAAKAEVVDEVCPVLEPSPVADIPVSREASHRKDSEHPPPPAAPHPSPPPNAKPRATGLRRGFFPPTKKVSHMDMRGPSTADTTSAEECSCSSYVEHSVRRDRPERVTAQSRKPKSNVTKSNGTPASDVEYHRQSQRPAPPVRQHSSPVSNDDIYNDAKQYMNREAAESFYQRGGEALAEMDYPRAIRLFQKAAKLNPDHFSKAVDMVEIVRNITEAAAKEDKLSEAHLQEQADASGSGAESEQVGGGPASEEAQYGNSGTSEHGGDSAGFASFTDDASPNQEQPQASRPQFFSRSNVIYRAAVLSSSVVVFVLSILSASALWLWSHVPGILPGIAGLVGRHEVKNQLAQQLRDPSVLRSMLLCVSLAVGLAGCAVSVFLVYWVLHLVALIGSSMMSLSCYAASEWFNLLFWRPAWFVAWPSSSALLYQRRMLFLHLFWSYPIMWWAVNGGWWGAMGSIAALGFAMLGGGVLLGGVTWFLISWELRLLSWWLSAPAILLTIVGWLFLSSLISSAQQAAGEEGNGSADAPIPGRLSTVAPKGATGEVARVLKCSDYFQVLELSPESCTDDQVRRAKKIKALATHPDKLGDGAVGAALAFQRITEAADALGEEAARMQYSRALAMATQAENYRQAQRSRPHDSSAAPDGSGIQMRCSACQGQHTIFPTGIPVAAARWCDKCNSRHPARDGDGWLENSGGIFASSTQVFMAADGVVYDITSWAECGGVTVDGSGNPLACNTHIAPLHFTNAAGTFGSRGRSAPNSPTSSGKNKAGRGRKKGGRRR